MASSYRMELDKWLSSIHVKADKVLDLGGSQLPIKGRTASWDVREYHIADLPDPHVDSPKPEYELDLNNPWLPGEYKDIISNVVFCLEVFEYVYDPKTAFDNLEKVLMPGGKAYVSFPSVYPLHQPIQDDALRYMPGGIQKLAQVSGLVIANMTPRRFETNAYQMLYSAERMRAAKGEDHNFSGWLVEFRR